MKKTGLALAAIGLVTFCAAAMADAPPIGFDGAKWIWSYGGNLNSMSAGSAYFRGEVSVPEAPALKSAEVIVTCDNLFVLYINGRPWARAIRATRRGRAPNGLT